jgi:transcriptional regulator with XRE-family HTH domain
MKITEITPTVDVLKELGKRIKKTRIQRGLTQTELSEQSGIYLRTINNIENGENFTILNLIQVLRALNALSLLDHILNQETTSPKDFFKLKKERSRVSKKKSSTDWTWGNET